MIYDKKHLSGHHVRPHLGFRWTRANFGRLMYDDRQLFAALIVRIVSKETGAASVGN